MVDYTWQGDVPLNGSEVITIIGGLIPVKEELETKLKEETARIESANNETDVLMATNAVDNTASRLLFYKNLIEKLDKLV